MQVRRVLVVFAVGVAVSWVVTWSARGGDATGPAAAPAPAPAAVEVEVEVEKLDGTKLTGRFAGRTLRFQAYYGVVELDVVRVAALSLTPPEAPQTQVLANVTLADKSHLVGYLLMDTLAVEGGDGQPATLPLAQLAEVKFLHPRDTSIVGSLIALLTLTIMEIVLGVDNVIFLAILAGKLPEEKRPRARKIGLAAALGTRLVLLLGLSTLMGLTKSVFTLPELPFLDTAEARGVSWRDIVLLAGGTFLIGKSVFEMHEKVEHAKAGNDAPPARSSFLRVIITIAIIDVVFSLDSVITAIGMVNDIWVMVTGMVLAMLVMLGFAGPISRFVDNHPTIKILA